MLRIGTPALRLAAVALTLAAAIAARAVSTSFWRAETFEDFDAGTPRGTSILEDGSVVLSHRSEEIAVPDAQYVWAAAEHGDDVYAVAGTPGRLYRLRGGKSEVLLETDTADFPALVVTPDGRVFVGTAPGGEVYEVRGDGSSGIFFETGEGYVWAMAYSREYGLLVGTGDSAKVFAVDGDGAGEVVHESAEASISALAVVEGRLLAGTAVGGMLLDITPGGDLAVLYDSHHDEVTGIALGEDGHTYFSATTVVLDEVFDGGDPESSLGEGSVFRTAEKGAVIELWHSVDAPVTCLGRGPDGSIWAGTGSRGRILSVGPRGQMALVADLEHEEILSIRGTGGRTIVSTGLAGSTFRFGPGIGESGVFESDVLDARSTARWGELSWRATTPGGSRVRLQTRSGNTEVPGDTWSEWSTVEGDGEGSITSPPARFLQWRAELAIGSGKRSPVLLAAEAAFLRENLPPVLNTVRVSEPSDALIDAEGAYPDGPVTQTLPSGLQVTYSLSPTAEPSRDLPVLTRGLRTAEWEAHDPNGDLLSFDLWVRSEDEDEWKLLAEDLQRAAHTWDTQSMPDGRYAVRVRADDGPDNPPDLAGFDDKESAPFIVDNTPPGLADLGVSADRGSVSVVGRVEDRLSAVARVEVAIDYGEWRSAFADDGMFDSLAEGFALSVSDLGAGEHSVSIRAIDRAGNVATARRVVR